MKRFLPLLLFLFLISNNLYAQENDFNKTYNDYLQSLNQYRQSYKEYLTAKQSYLNYKTLTSKNEAFLKTLKMLEGRDQVIANYLNLLKIKLRNITGIVNYKQNILYLKLDDEITWYDNHKNILSSTGSLEDLLNLSQETEKRYQEKTETLIYQTLGNTLIGKEDNLRDKVNSLVVKLKEKIKEIKEKGNKNTNLPERWLLEVENRLLLSLEKENQANNLLEKIDQKTRNRQQTFSQAQLLLEESHQYLKEANFYLKEVIREVKNAD